MNKSSRRIRQDLAAFSPPKYSDLPALPLYMDQVVTYMNQILDPINFTEDSKLLTSSMVNNYVKNSIVKPPYKKQYQPYHLAYLFVVCAMKRCYSLSEISSLINMYSDISDQERISQDYNKFVSVFQDSLQDVFSTGTCKKEYFEHPTMQQQLMVNVIRTLAYKIYGEYQLLEYREKTDISSESE